MQDRVAIKFVITGPYASGKTTLVRTMSEIPIVGTEAAMQDFGKLTVAEEDLTVELSLFGTPGQRRFNFKWDVLAEGMDGYVVVVDMSRPGSFDDAAVIIEHFRNMSDAPFVIAANRGYDSLDGVAERLGVPEALVIACDATERESARDVLLALLEAVLYAVGHGTE